MVDFFSPHVTGLLVNSNFSAMESERASESYIGLERCSGRLYILVRDMPGN